MLICITAVKCTYSVVNNSSVMNYLSLKACHVRCAAGVLLLLSQSFYVLFHAFLCFGNPVFAAGDLDVWEETLDELLALFPLLQFDSLQIGLSGAKQRVLPSSPGETKQLKIKHEKKMMEDLRRQLH